ncbi:hypothetical protein HHI36_014878, partial [Cryptolaemus montrouzieri]
ISDLEFRIRNLSRNVYAKKAEGEKNTSAVNSQNSESEVPSRNRIRIPYACTQPM